MDSIMDDFKPTRSYSFIDFDIVFDEWVNNGTGCWHYNVTVSDDDEGMGFDTTEKLSEPLMQQIARIASYAASLYREYGYNTAQRDMRKALGIS